MLHFSLKNKQLDTNYKILTSQRLQLNRKKKELQTCRNRPPNNQFSAMGKADPILFFPNL